MFLNKICCLSEIWEYAVVMRLWIYILQLVKAGCVYLRPPFLMSLLTKEDLHPPSYSADYTSHHA